MLCFLFIDDFVSASENRRSTYDVMINISKCGTLYSTIYVSTSLIQRDVNKYVPQLTVRIKKKVFNDCKYTKYKKIRSILLYHFL